MSNFGEHLRALRLKGGKTLRQFCAENNLDPGNLSRIERGRLNPPASHDTLTRWAHALGLREASSDWIDFFDLAAIASGRVPQDLRDDEAVLAKLPLLFRTLRNEKIDDEALQDLIDLIRKD